MPASFLPRLINGPFQDPGLFVPFSFQKKALLFDLGDITPLSPRDILKVSHVFISHTHMDHFIGFDHLLRLSLGRSKTIHLYGPTGLLANIEGKLAGYSWDLVDNYENPLILTATEVHPDFTLTRSYHCRNRFQPVDPPQKEPVQNGKILEEPDFSLTAIILDHSIPCLGFILTERFHVNIKKTEVQALGLSTGPWLNNFKQAIFANMPDDTIFEIPDASRSSMRRFTLGELSAKITEITRGQKIGYITDIRYTPENIEKLIPSVQGADHLFIEAAFLDEHTETAAAKNHLTARQAGEICGRAGVARYTIFHFSPRYTDTELSLYREAEKAYQQARKDSRAPA